MNATQLFRDGKLQETIDAVTSLVRNDPANTKNRTFLFELLCFNGDYDRAEKQLDALLDSREEAMRGIVLYKATIHAQKTRESFFENKEYQNSSEETAPVTGCELNGKKFEAVKDVDPRVGARLEVYAGGSFMWIPFQHIQSIHIPEPKRLRDLLWAPAQLKTAPTFEQSDLGEVFLPVLTADASQDESEKVRLGRETYFARDEDGLEIPVGQKMLLVGEEELPLLEVRDMTILPATAAA
jgi:type VI secretion system protein ImpE